MFRMHRNPVTDNRELKTDRLAADLAVIGGGLAGCCAAITAARAGCRVILVQDRPVLGGNASSEVRLWILGATSHMGNNNRWAREGGVIDELLVENMYRNPEGNPLILDTIILEMVTNEPNITLLLNSAVHHVEKSDPQTIASVRAFNPQNSTLYHIAAPLFVDASGDGIVGFLSGAAFRIGAECRAEFGELFAPETASSELLGHTIYFYSKDTGRPVKFTPPAFALRDITSIPRWRDIQFNDSGCRLWWLEWGGKLDTIHDAEKIKWELWKVAYGVWDYIKNSGQFPDAETLTLEWVGTIPGKRESRRFEGDYIITQHDVVEQRLHPDAVSFGGWAIDLHPPDGVYSPQPGCQQWHSRGVYQVPYRSLFSRNISNLFLAGRAISASHIAFGSTRVMATCAHGAQAVGMAAFLCSRAGLRPRDLLEPAHMCRLQQALLRAGQHIPGVAASDPHDLAPLAHITATSQLRLSGFAPSGRTMPLAASWAMMLPVPAGPMPVTEFLLNVSCPTTLHAQLRVSTKPANHTPDTTLASLAVPLQPGQNQPVPLNFNIPVDVPRYAFVCLMANPHIEVHLSDQRVTGVLAVTQKFNRAVAKSPRQDPPPGSGIHSFEFWIPQRRPAGHNLALKIHPPLAAFEPANLTNGFARPTNQPNAWVADFAHHQPTIRLAWQTPQTIATIELSFDTDFDHPMESVLMGHPERAMPFCVRNATISARSPVGTTSTPALRSFSEGGSSPSTASTPVLEPSVSPLRDVSTPCSATAAKADVSRRSCAEADQLLLQLENNYQTRRVITLNQPIRTDQLEIRLVAPAGNIPAALFAVRCYGAVHHA